MTRARSKHIKEELEKRDQAKDAHTSQGYWRTKRAQLECFEEFLTMRAFVKFNHADFWDLGAWHTRSELGTPLHL